MLVESQPKRPAGRSGKGNTHSLQETRNGNFRLGPIGEPFEEIEDHARAASGKLAVERAEVTADSQLAHTKSGSCQEL
jgi:hypothetical protein